MAKRKRCDDCGHPYSGEGSYCEECVEERANEKAEHDMHMRESLEAQEDADMMEMTEELNRLRNCEASLKQLLHRASVILSHHKKGEPIPPKQLDLLRDLHDRTMAARYFKASPLRKETA